MLVSRVHALAPLLVVTVLSALAVSALASQWRTAVSQPEIVVLGSGNSLSVLVRSGQSRLLIAAGDDIDSFNRAYGSVLRPTISRLDVLVVAGSGRQVVVPERLVMGQVGRSVLSMRPIGAGQSNGALHQSDVTVLRHSTEVQLTADLTVTINPYLDEVSADLWSVTMRNKDSRVVVVPSLEAIPADSLPASAVVVTGQANTEGLITANARAIIARGSDAGDLLPLTTNVTTTSFAAQLWMVHPGEHLRIRLADGHIALEAAHARQVRYDVRTPSVEAGL
ncbi:MAG: hypothetical protein ACR2LS_11305 [Thermomicrobiales bacterium]